jgi:hypothetical protein
MPTLDEQIRAAMGMKAPEDTTVIKTASVRPTPTHINEHEKLATALEFIGKRGVVNMVKEAQAPATNAGQSHAAHAQSTVRPHKAAPPMAPKAVGEADHDLGTRPGGAGAQAQIRGKAQTHHSALGSNKAAIDFDKREKAKQTAADLQSLFDATPYADKKLKENLSSAGAKGDKNIKVKTAGDREMLRRALASKLAKQEG